MCCVLLVAAMVQDGGALCNSCSGRSDAVDSEVKSKHAQRGWRAREKGEEEEGGRIKREVSRTGMATAVLLWRS